MIISLNWLKDFVDVPADTDPRKLALQFTLATAEVEGVEHVKPNFDGLLAAKIESIEPEPGNEKLQRVVVQADKRYSSVSAAPDLSVGDMVIYAPPGSVIAGHTIGTTDPAGRKAEGMIVAGQSIGLVQSGANAIFLPPSFKPGETIDRGLFEDWLIEIDNKSITHRPDCWGHYGIAREVAAILKLPLKPYAVTETSALQNDALPEIPIEIDDPTLAPRYTGLLMKGLASQPAPLWMQVRLALVGMRPIDLLVDLTNYIMLELGQPMHAFDGASIPNIQVATAAEGETFTTLDNVKRTMPPNTLMIQSNRKSVAIAGVMGGAATEVTEKTDTVLLESANFEAATIRRAATAMGHRTEASTRFEKSLDPENTVLGIARFHKLAQDELPGLELAGTLSDCYPAPKAIRPIELDCDYVARFIGKDVSPEQIIDILSAIEFKCEKLDGNKLRVTPPTYRATKDIEIEVDLIEEVARFVGYNNIEPTLPRVTSRYFEQSPSITVEDRTLEYLCVGGDFAEVHNYIWYDDVWLKTLGFDPGECITLKNPASDNCPRLRGTMMPGLLAMADRNRQRYSRFQLAEVGTVFETGRETVEESQHRNLGIVCVQAGKKSDGLVWKRMQLALDSWARQVLEDRLAFCQTTPQYVWEDPDRIAEIEVAGERVGRISMMPLTCKQRIDERLKAWSIGVAELNLTAVAKLTGRHEKLPTVPKHPQVRLDFSTLADAARHYASVEKKLGGFKHELLKRLSFVESFEGGSVPTGKRSLLFRAEIGRDDRTLSNEDIQGFQGEFKGFLGSLGLELRS